MDPRLTSGLEEAYRTQTRACDGSLVYPREFWATKQLWDAAKRSMDHCGRASSRIFHDRYFKNRSEAHIPRLSTLAMDALPQFLAAECNERRPSAQWKRAIRSFTHEECVRAWSRENAIRELEEKTF